MGFRFVIGRANMHHSSYILDEMTELLNKEPLGPEVLLLVPDQMTFQQEYELFQKNRVVGSMRGQVSSFSRLAWRVIQETGGKTRKHISSNGIQMALRKVIEQKTDDWKVFQKVLEKQGFLTQLEGMITEFKRHDVTPEHLKAQITAISQFVHKTAQEAALEDKLTDLTYIYEGLNQALQEKYLDGEGQLDLLIEAIEDTDLFIDSTIFIDGFYRFTPKELRVVEALLTRCKSMTMSLIVDPDEIANGFSLSELDLFYQTKETFIEMKKLVEQTGRTFLEPHVLENSYAKFSKKSRLKHLEKNFTIRPTPASLEKPPIHVVEAVHPRAEVEGAAQAILKLAREKETRFRDIAIFIRDGEVYHDTIKTVFKDYDIPVFIDEKKPMLHHSLIELVRSLLEAIETDWRYEPLFRVLKTGFILANDEEEHPLTLDAIDILENYVIQFGIRHKLNWIKNEDWSFQKFTSFEERVRTDKEIEYEVKINSYKNQVAKTLITIDEDINNAKTVREFCEAIYLFLEALDLPSQLEELQEIFLEQGKLEKSQEQEQVWDALIQLFDEIVEIAGEEEIDLNTFRKILDTGFESLEFAHVPPAIDQVIVGTVDQSRIGHMDHAFLLGVNEGLWPLKPSSDRVMTEEERDLLKANGLPLADTSSRQLLDDMFYMYLGFTTATESLWVSYSISNGEGQSKIPSQMINRLYELYPELPKPILLQDPDELYDARRFVTTQLMTRSTLATQLARYERGYDIDEIWLDIYNWYVDNESKFSTTYNILQSLNYTNKPTSLKKETVEELYSKKLRTSVSRLEMYQRCSYQHFLRYGLNLDERERYTFKAPDMGQLFHEALRQITEWVIEERTDFKDVTKDDSKKYANRAVKKLGSVMQNRILESSQRYQYIQRKLEKVIARATFILSEQSRISDFSPVGLELRFGEDEKVGPLIIPLENGYELILRGQIDRVDEMRKDEDLYLRIIDYKSKETKLNLAEVYYGLSLQMLLYLEVVLQESEEWLGQQAKSAGVLYFHVHDPMISSDSEMPETRLEKEILKEYKLRGLVPSEVGIIQGMDNTLESGWSDILSIAINKDGGIRSGSQVASGEDFTRLQEHIKQIVVRAGLELTNGDIKLNPFDSGEKTACRFCPYKSVCQFDPILETNEYHLLPKMDDKTVLKKLLEETGDD